MDKIFSSRIDESVIHRIDNLAKHLQTSKKNVIENAIQMYAQKIEKEGNIDVLEQTLGAWQRKESPGKTVEKSRKTFRNSISRYQK
ncbi:MAG: hypothetical protein V3U15_00205 [Nitrospinota bacterium]